MNLELLLKILEEHGWGGTIFLAILILIYTLVKSQWFSSLLTKTTERFVETFMKNKTKDLSLQIRSISESDITNHDIFNYIDFWMYSKVPTFKFSTEYRTVVFRKYLTIYLRNYKKNISNLVTSKEYQTMDQAQITQAMLKLLNNIVYDYEKEIRDVGLPQIVIDKMKLKNNDTITLTIDLIEGISNSQFYQSEKNLLKVYSILNIMLSVLENTISNSEEVCDSINGQLKGLTFTDAGKKYTEP
jgi:hypothetical protein